MTIVDGPPTIPAERDERDGRTETQDVFEVNWPKAPTGIPSRYDVLSQIGSGGMGMVYKVHDRETDEIIALKILKSGIAADPAMQENLRKEVCLARKVTHKNVCRIHEFNRSSGTAYVSMEFVDGESLLSRLHRCGPLPWTEALAITRQICAGLREAHVQGIVHRDSKPANIMVDQSGVVKIMDFGIARLLQGTGHMTGTLVGTPAYMAPEQVELKRVDARTDVYALGLLLYEIVTGSQAFEGDSPIAVALKQLRDFPKRPREIVPALPVRAEAIILKCLQKNPTKRFQSVDELANVLRREADSRPPASMWDDFIADYRRAGRDLQRSLQPRFEAAGDFLVRQNWQALTRKHPQRTLAAGLVAACLLSGLVTFSLSRSRKSQVAGLAPTKTSAAVAVPSSQPPLPEALASDDAGTPAIQQIVSWPSGSPIADDDTPVASDKADLGSASDLAPIKTPSSRVASPNQPLPAAKVSRAKQDVKSQPAQVSASSSFMPRALQEPATRAARRAPSQSPVIDSHSVPQSAVPSPAPAATAERLSEESTEEATPELSVSSVSIVPTVAPEAAPQPTDAKSEQKTTDASPVPATGYLEVGSFKDSTWASHAVEKLAELGFHAVSVRKGRLWMQSYQVRVGPYKEAKDLEAARQDLVSQGFKPHHVN
jgi:serine/threonine protein kinase